MYISWQPSINTCANLPSQLSSQSDRDSAGLQLHFFDQLGCNTFVGPSIARYTIETDAVHRKHGQLAYLYFKVDIVTCAVRAVGTCGEGDVVL